MQLSCTTFSHLKAEPFAWQLFAGRGRSPSFHGLCLPSDAIGCHDLVKGNNSRVATGNAFLKADDLQRPIHATLVLATQAWGCSAESCLYSIADLTADVRCAKHPCKPELHEERLIVHPRSLLPELPCKDQLRQMQLLLQ